MRSTRHCGRQSSSRHTTRRLGRSRVMTVATASRKPRTALTGLPSGAVIEEGTPKKERNHMLAPSSSNTGAATVTDSSVRYGLQRGSNRPCGVELSGRGRHQRLVCAGAGHAAGGVRRREGGVEVREPEDQRAAGGGTEL